MAFWKPGTIAPGKQQWRRYLGKKDFWHLHWTGSAVDRDTENETDQAVIAHTEQQFRHLTLKQQRERLPVFKRSKFSVKKTSESIVWTDRASFRCTLRTWNFVPAGEISNGHRRWSNRMWQNNAYATQSRIQYQMRLIRCVLSRDTTILGRSWMDSSRETGCLYAGNYLDIFW